MWRVRAGTGCGEIGGGDVGGGVGGGVGGEWPLATASTAEAEAGTVARRGRWWCGGGSPREGPRTGGMRGMGRGRPWVAARAARWAARAAETALATAVAMGGSAAAREGAAGAARAPRGLGLAAAAAPNWRKIAENGKVVPMVQKCPPDPP